MPLSKTRTAKTGLHPNNPHRQRYDFAQLIKADPALAEYVTENQFGDLSVDFHDADAVKALNRALLISCYGLQFWDIPEGYLCPPIPGRADYIHHLATLLADASQGEIPRGRQIRGLDIGTGANCIYPIIGNRSYGWRFVGSDIDPVSIASASLICDANSRLKGQIECRQQTDQQHIFKGIILPSDRFDFTLCNPPFHSSAEQAASGSRRKLKNLGRKGSAPLNFGGQSNELWCEGGERGFIQKMIRESRDCAAQCYMFTTLVSQQDNLEPVRNMLRKQNVSWMTTVEMSQGQKKSRFIAWSFLTESEREEWTAGWGENKVHPSERG